ncbi:MAG: PilZ domain-containing protein [Erythrobacter sp.]
MAGCQIMVQPLALTAPATASEPVIPRPIGRRGAARLRLAIPVRIVSIHGTQTGILLDLSRTGARIGLAEPLTPGMCLYLKIARFELFAEVVRRDLGADGGINGLVFDEPLPDTTVLAVREHAEGFAQRQREALRDQVRRWVSGESRN